MYEIGRHKKSQAFALPTVLIASIVLLTILAVSVTATVAVRTVLKNQYYVQLAQVAGESGVAYAKACLAANGNVPLWSDAKPLTPATDCSGNVVSLSPTVSVLIVAGGGSGGGSTGGGGGAGGLIANTSVGISATSYPVVVGAGAAATAQQTTGTNGANSTFNGLSAVGGGGGGYSNGSTGGPGLNGGSGGGGENFFNSYAPGAGTVGQGNTGGIAAGGGSGGGGGAGGLGNPGSATNVGGTGGLGLQSNISGSTVYYAGGGGGAGDYGANSAGGSGIGGSGNINGTAGVVNSGSGGGGGWYYTGGSGGAGGSGIVVISYPVNSGIIATGGTITTVGQNKIHQFTASGTFAISSVGNVTCPSAPGCSVLVSGNVRSSFSVPKPSLDATTGQAVTIANNGYVEVTRTSTGGVWRTYKQPSVQAAVVPDLCSGNATSARGWAAAVKTTQQDTLPSASAAQTISLANSAINAGVIYFRRDFNVSKNASYDLNVYTSKGQDIAATYIDGALVSTTAGSLNTTAITLSTGCHTVVVQLTNATLVPRVSEFTASLTRSGSAVPIVVTNTSWRVTTGDPVHFSANNYFEAPGVWQQALDLGIWTNTTLPWGGAPTNWASVSGDSLTEWITTQYSSGGLNRPGDSYAWLRDTSPFTTSTTTTVRVTNYCDDRCDLYLDGNQVMSYATGAGLVSKSITVQPGTHTFGIRLYNAPSGNIGAALFAATDLSTNTVIARSSPNWDTTAYWLPVASVLEPYSYDSTYVPNPAVQTTANVRVLVVGGGGGGGSEMGGGGGGGGVIYNAAYSLTANTYTVTVGSGGSGAPAGVSQVRGSNGGNSNFGTIRALGGGGGGSEYSLNISPPGAGASSGGSAGCNQNLYAGYVIGQGYGSAGTPGCYYPTGGGGAGGSGAANPATGGVGVSNAIFGTAYFFGGGGGGSGYTGPGGNGGNGGGAGGAIGVTTGGSGLNAGGNGNGGATVAQANVPGSNGGANTGGGGSGGSHYNSNNYGGAGGSGIVVIAVPLGTMAISAPSAVITTFGSYTLYRFNSSATFTVTAVNAPPARSTNIAPPFSQWTLAGGATYDSNTGQVTIPPGGNVVSPLILVSMPVSMTVGGDFYSSSPSPNAAITPQAAFHYGSQYYQADGTTLATSTAGYSGNGCALGFTQSVWDNNDLRNCGWYGGPNTVYTRLYLYGSSSGYASPNLILRNPQFVTY